MAGGFAEIGTADGMGSEIPGKDKIGKWGIDGATRVEGRGYCVEPGLAGRKGVTWDDTEMRVDQWMLQLD